MILPRKKHLRGFTLIELLIAISIIAILSSIGFVSYSQAQLIARDGKRKEDIALIATALELYYQTNKTYAPPDSVRDYNAGADGCVQAALGPYLTADYINKLPEDPKFTGGSFPSATNWCYFYNKGTFDGRKSYTLYARLENPPKSGDPNTCQPQQLYRLEIATFNYCFSP